MWDSLESIWKAAFNDKENCNTYVVPIPYADLTKDGKAAKWNCEIDLFPKNVPVLDYRKVNLKKLKADAIFIHNPYDNYNRVTSVDSNYYSANLKLLTKLLIYVPYYATSGIMSESQKYMPSYDNVDYIVIQSEAMQPFFDSSIPIEKLLPLGSPKFDRVIHMCQNPPKVPEKWKNKIEGKKVYFYNTSLGGLLEDTKRFLKKMRYIFESFDGRQDTCLLWRPHPLINATLSSMREEFQLTFNQLKNYFVEHEIGIYDDTPDVDKSIALSDVYIGDVRTSLTSLFGVAGKPMFFLNNKIVKLPSRNTWKSKYVSKFNPKSKNWIVSLGNKLYNSEDMDFHYKYYCSLSEYDKGNYYLDALEIDNKVYVCPANAQDILVVSNHNIERRIPLKNFQNIKGDNLFFDVVYVDNCIFILPNHYPYIVCYNIKNDTLNYLKFPRGFFEIPNRDTPYRLATGVWNDNLLVASPNFREILLINVKTLEMKQMTIPSASKANFKGGFISMIQDGDTFWLLPHVGKSIVRLDMSDGTIREYNNLPKGFQCQNLVHGLMCEERPFSSGFCNEEELFLAPYWGNMFVRLNKKTGYMQEWKTQFDISSIKKDSEFNFKRIGIFEHTPDKKEIYFFCVPNIQWYVFNLENGTFDKIDINFDVNELKEHEADGFSKSSEWSSYGCSENVFQSLKDLLDGTLPGKPFSREAQLAAYERLNASADGTAGEKIYQFVKEKLLEK